jgi:hypothetical protein
MLTDMFAKGDGRKFSLRHLRRIFAVSPGDLYVYKWEEKKGKNELIIDFPSTLQQTSSIFASGALSEFEIEKRRNKFKEALLSILYKFFYSQLHAMPSTFSPFADEGLAKDEVDHEQAKTWRRWPEFIEGEDCDLKRVPDIRLLLEERIRKAVEKPPPMVKAETVSEYFS